MRKYFPRILKLLPNSAKKVTHILDEVGELVKF